MHSSNRFFSSRYFAVVGASTSREKFGNKVLRWYQSNQLDVIPVHPKEPSIEGLSTIHSIQQLAHPEETSLSIITPPSITHQVLQLAEQLGIQHVWIQPGAEDEAVKTFAQQSQMNIILNACILVDHAKF